ncbi:MAG: tRNA U34 5-methylaminomethyl-2-thiouridine-forming methyltransferase MnmC [Gammaproteobacteria bacterium]|jgi:tRNA U34 5-methylaminomethyl-2-thiouridine-forming methyltransferase MnmC
MINQTASLTWQTTDAGRVPVSDQFDDPYYSLKDGVAETQYVFLAGNNLPDRFGGDFHIGELGFGTGLNFLVTWDAWIKSGAKGQLRFTSFEAYPMAISDMQAALIVFPQLAHLADILLDKWHPDAGAVALADGICLEVIIGDARQTLPAWDGAADAWYLDGFSPDKNPELWEPALLEHVAKHTAPDGTAATYSAAGHIRKSLDVAGFDVTRIKGFGRKWHMTVARLRNAK